MSEIGPLVSLATDITTAELPLAGAAVTVTLEMTTLLVGVADSATDVQSQSVPIVLTKNDKTMRRTRLILPLVVLRSSRCRPVSVVGGLFKDSRVEADQNEDRGFSIGKLVLTHFQHGVERSITWPVLSQGWTTSNARFFTILHHE